MNLFTATDYRVALKALIKKQRSEDPGFRMGKLAESAQVQATYLSNVLGGRAHLSGDQFFDILTLFSLGDSERSYLMGLHEWQRSASKLRRESLQKELQSIRSAQSRVPARLALESPVSETEFYLDPFHVLIHTAMSVPAYARRPEEFARRVGIPSEKLKASLRYLQRVKLIEPAAHGWAQRDPLRHLADESPYCLPFQALIRAMSQNQLFKLPSSGKKSLVVTFSADASLKADIEEKIVSLLKKLKSRVESREPEKVYQLNLDFFPWD